MNTGNISNPFAYSRSNLPGCIFTVKIAVSQFQSINAKTQGAQEYKRSRVFSAMASWIHSGLASWP